MSLPVSPKEIKDIHTSSRKLAGVAEFIRSWSFQTHVCVDKHSLGRATLKLVESGFSKKGEKLC